MRNCIALLRNDDSGSAAIEFALIGPAFLGMFMGILQIGLGMQNYNALRSISADVSRYAVVNYQTSNRLSTAQLQTYANSIATAPPYGLTSSRFTSAVTTAGTQRVAGATEYTIQLTYQIPSLLQVIGIGEIPLSYSRPIFVLS